MLTDRQTDRTDVLLWLLWQSEQATSSSIQLHPVGSGAAGHAVDLQPLLRRQQIRTIHLVHPSFY